MAAEGVTPSRNTHKRRICNKIGDVQVGFAGANESLSPYFDNLWNGFHFFEDANSGLHWYPNERDVGARAGFLNGTVDAILAGGF